MEKIAATLGVSGKKHQLFCARSAGKLKE